MEQNNNIKAILPLKEEGLMVNCVNLPNVQEVESTKLSIREEKPIHCSLLNPKTDMKHKTDELLNMALRVQVEMTKSWTEISAELTENTEELMKTSNEEKENHLNALDSFKDECEETNKEQSFIYLLQQEEKQKSGDKLNNPNKSLSPKVLDKVNEKKVSKLMIALEKAKREIELAKEKLETKRKEKSDDEKKFNKQFQTIQKELCSLTQQHNKLSEKFETTKNMLKIEKVNADEYKKRLKNGEDTYKNSIKEYEASKSHMRFLIFEAQTRASKIEVMFNNLQRENASLKSSNRELRFKCDENNKFKEEIKFLTLQLNKKNAELQKHQHQTNFSENCVQDLGNKMQVLQETRNDLAHNLKQLENLRNSLLINSQSISKNKQLEELLNEKQAEIDMLQQNFNLWKKTVKHHIVDGSKILNVLNEKYQNEHEEFQMKLEEKINENTNLEKKCLELQEKFSRQSDGGNGENWTQDKYVKLKKQLLTQHLFTKKLTEENNNLIKHNQQLKEQLDKMEAQFQLQKEEIEKSTREISAKKQFSNLLQDFNEVQNSMIKWIDENRILTQKLSRQDVTLSDVNNNNSQFCQCKIEEVRDEVESSELNIKEENEKHENAIEKLNDNLQTSFKNEDCKPSTSFEKEKPTEPSSTNIETIVGHVIDREKHIVPSQSLKTRLISSSACLEPLLSQISTFGDFLNNENVTDSQKTVTLSVQSSQSNNEDKDMVQEQNDLIILPKNSLSSIQKQITTSSSSGLKRFRQLKLESYHIKQSNEEQTLKRIRIFEVTGDAKEN